MMKIVLILSALALLANANLFDRYNSFQKYTKQYSKEYESKTIEFYRFAIYLRNMITIEKLNNNPHDDAIYGQTRFTDLTPNQAKALSGLVVPQKPVYNFVKNFTNDPHYKPKESTPDNWDWRDKKAVGPIRDQGSCGSCWSFSTAGNIESLNFLKKGGEFVPLSMQQLIDCDISNYGCNGGWPYFSIFWISENGGLMKYDDYPLRTNYTGPCNFDEKKAEVQVKGYMNISHDEDIIKDALYETGPLSILLDFTGMMHYKSGIANPLLCSDWPDHALVLVGYGHDDKKKEDFWTIKNSWGPKWGEQGFLKLKRGHSKCGIQKWAVTAVFE